MKLDIVFCTYNSQKWIENCVSSIVNSRFDLKKISLIFYDNCSTDNTVNEIKRLKTIHKEKFNNFIVEQGENNKGFGYGNNRASELGRSPYIFIFNVDTEVFPDTFSKLEEIIQNSDESVGVWELAQRPYEHPKFYNPITRETTWASGACMVVKREVFEKVNGFDEKIFMYAEDVDISWHIRSLGYKIHYLYDVPIMHYSYSEANEFKYIQFVYSFINNWYLRAKYGTIRNYFRGIINLLRVFKGSFISEENKKKYISDIRKLVIKTLLKKGFPYLFKCLFKSVNRDFKPQFYGINDYEIPRSNPFFSLNNNNNNIFISVILMIEDQDSSLDYCLQSINNQDYRNFDVNIFNNVNNLQMLTQKIKGDYVLIIKRPIILFPDCLSIYSQFATNIKQDVFFTDYFVYKGNLFNDEYNINNMLIMTDIDNQYKPPILVKKDSLTNYLSFKYGEIAINYKNVNEGIMKSRTTSVLFNS